VQNFDVVRKLKNEAVAAAVPFSLMIWICIFVY
jgi:hypothetical protein